MRVLGHRLRRWLLWLFLFLIFAGYLLTEHSHDHRRRITLCLKAYQLVENATIISNKSDSVIFFQKSDGTNPDPTTTTIDAE
jgi:hypothetical protein